MTHLRGSVSKAQIERLRGSCDKLHATIGRGVSAGASTSPRVHVHNSTDAKSLEK